MVVVSGGSTVPGPWSALEASVNQAVCDGSIMEVRTEQR